MENFIHLKDQDKSNDLEAYNLEGAACIQVFEFECELNKEDTVKLRDFLDSVVKSNDKFEPPDSQTLTTRRALLG